MIEKWMIRGKQLLTEYLHVEDDDILWFGIIARSPSPSLNSVQKLSK